MTKKELEYVQGTIEGEGFYYAMAFYSDFKKEVKDPKFHELREKMLEAAAELATYCGVEHNA